MGHQSRLARLSTTRNGGGGSRTPLPREEGEESRRTPPPSCNGAFDPPLPLLMRLNPPSRASPES